MSVTILAAGLATTLQDEGRPGRAALGVPRSGALDRPAYALANRLVGNLPGAATLETTFGGLALRTAGSLWFTVTGAPAPVTVDGREVGSHGVVFAAAGARIAVGTPYAGVRSYLAVRGGFVPEPVLGSRSEDLLSGIRAVAIRPGTELPVGPSAHLSEPVVDAVAPGLLTPPLPPPGPTVLDVLVGPRAEWIEATSLLELLTRDWTVSAESNRVGVRLAGPILARSITDELPSEGVLPGAIQIPPSGQPVVFLADHPVTGGYPVVAVVAAASLPVLAQIPPGAQLRFRPVA